MKNNCITKCEDDKKEGDKEKGWKMEKRRIAKQKTEH